MRHRTRPRPLPSLWCLALFGSCGLVGEISHGAVRFASHRRFRQLPAPLARHAVPSGGQAVPGPAARPPAVDGEPSGLVPPPPPPRRRWRQWIAAAAAGSVALLSPAACWARAARRVASRKEEQKASVITVVVLGLLFTVAYFNSKKEDDSEDRRIKSEVQRLVRLKKEFEEAENSEETSDDSLAAGLRAAQEKLAKGEDDAEAGEEDKEEGKGDGDGEGEPGPTGGDEPPKPPEPPPPAPGGGSKPS